MDILKELEISLFGSTEEGCCINCKKPFTIQLGKNTKKLGNIYSEQGVKEMTISKVCETCFDKMFGG